MQDDDVASLVVSPPASMSLNEGESGAYSLVLTSQPVAAVTISIAITTSTGSTATPLTLNSQQLTFSISNWYIEQQVVLAAIDDQIQHPDTSFTLTHVTSSNDLTYAALPAVMKQVRLVENDAAGLVFQPSALNILEGSNATYSIMLRSQPTSSVSISVVSDNDSSIVVQPRGLQFSPLAGAPQWSSQSWLPTTQYSSLCFGLLECCTKSSAMMPCTLA